LLETLVQLQGICNKMRSWDIPTAWMISIGSLAYKAMVLTQKWADTQVAPYW